MGASGAGKTSLLNILSGRARSSGRMKIEADVRLDNYSVDPTNIKVRVELVVVRYCCISKNRNYGQIFKQVLIICVIKILKIFTLTIRNQRWYF